jgi:acyl-coenzyme A synthetase/AMP-(fatty) acid ligase
VRDEHLFGIARKKPYAELVREFRWNIPETFNFGVDVVDAWAAERDGLAILWENGAGQEASYRFSDVARLSNKLAATLHRQGVAKGDRVIVKLPRIPEWQIALIACLKLGAVVVPCIEMLTQRDIEYRVRNSEARAAICRGEQVEKFATTLDEIPIRIAIGAVPGWIDWQQALSAGDEGFDAATVRAEDPAIMYYTSGSTGHPKGVLHASRGLYVWRIAAFYWLDLTPEDRIWCTADTGWSKAGTSIIWGPWSCGSCAFFYDGPYVPAQRVRLLAKHRISVFCASSTELNRVAAEDFRSVDISALRRTISAGEAVNPAIAERWEKATGCKVSEAYGQTEALMMVLNYPSEPLRYGSMGRPQPGLEIAIVDDEGRELRDGEEGNVALKAPSPHLMLGYWKDPERTAACYVDGPSGRWYLSGDRGMRDAEGWYWYAGRADDVINSAGYRIGPLEVENALLEHPAVQECAVVASPDAERGEIVKAFIVLKEGVSGSPTLVAELQDHVKSVTAPYKYPRAIEFIAELPKTVTGKIRRRTLRDQEVAKSKPKPA